MTIPKNLPVENPVCEEVDLLCDCEGFLGSFSASVKGSVVKGSVATSHDRFNHQKVAFRKGNGTPYFRKIQVGEILHFAQNIPYYILMI